MPARSTPCAVCGKPCRGAKCVACYKRDKAANAKSRDGGRSACLPLLGKYLHRPRQTSKAKRLGALKVAYACLVTQDRRETLLNAHGLTMLTEVAA